MTHCSVASLDRGEPMPGTAPRADTWVVVEHPEGWGDAPLARAGDGVRVLMARGGRAPGSRVTVRVWVAHVLPVPDLRVGSVTDPSEVAGWDLSEIAAGSRRAWGRPDPEPLLLVCANGRRDRCCGHEGGRLARELQSGADKARVLTCTHLGGHRFAPTALVLPFGVLHGRLDEVRAAELLPLARAGRTPISTLRGFSTHAPAEQVADAEVRRRLGHDAIRPLDAVEVPGPGPQVCVRVTLPRPQGCLDVVVGCTTDEVVASCGRAPQPTQSWSVIPSPPVPRG